MNDDPISDGDSFEVPVFVKHSSPLVPQGRPQPWRVAAASTPWPADGVPPDGAYTITTSWREVMFAALTVGRNVTPWLDKVPQLAGLEILSRQAPIRAYLRRRALMQGTSMPRTGVVTNDVYQRGTEVTARGAFGYRIGMTMAEWLCWGQLGMSHSLHAETSCPPDTDPELWRARNPKPDLIGLHPQYPSNWII